MKHAQISFTLPNKEIKDLFMKKTKSQGISMKTAILSFMEDYIKNSYSIKLVKDDTEMTDSNKKNWITAKEDLKNNTNIVSQDEIFAKYL